MLARGETVGHLSRWKGRACGVRSPTCARTASRTSSRWSRSLTGRARWRNIPTYCSRKRRPRADRIHAPQASSRSLRRPTASSRTRSRCKQIARDLAGYSLGKADNPAPRDGQEKTGKENGLAARRLRSRARVERGIERGTAEAIFEALREIRRIRPSTSRTPRRTRLLTYPETAYMKAELSRRIHGWHP